VRIVLQHRISVARDNWELAVNRTDLARLTASRICAFSVLSHHMRWRSVSDTSAALIFVEAAAIGGSSAIVGATVADVVSCGHRRC